MAYTFSKVYQAVMTDLGKVPELHRFAATSGSTTMIENTLWGSRDNAPDDDYCKDWYAVVVRDAGGAGAAPEGEIARISAYSSTTYQYTLSDTLSAAVASGDDIMIANSDIPMREVLAAANRALQDLGEVTSVDSSLTMTTSPRYTIPVGLRRDLPVRVEYDDDDADERIGIYDAKISADGYLYIPEQYLITGRVIYLTYVGPHTALTGASSQISEDIHPALINAAATAYALQWLNGTQAGGSDYWRQRENKAWADLAQAKVSHPVRRYPRPARFFVAGTAQEPPLDDVTRVRL